MRQTLAITLAISVFLTGCSAQRAAAHSAGQIPGLYASAHGFSARVETTVNRGDTENDFTLLWTTDDSGASIEIAAPESVAGIRAVITPDTRSLVYDGAALTLPETVSPLELLPMLSLAWENPYAAFETGDGSVTLFYYETHAGEAYELRTRFDAETLLPLEAAVFCGGERIVLYRFSLFSFT